MEHIFYHLNKKYPLILFLDYPIMIQKNYENYGFFHLFHRFYQKQNHSFNFNPVVVIQITFYFFTLTPLELDFLNFNLIINWQINFFVLICLQKFHCAQFIIHQFYLINYYFKIIINIIVKEHYSIDCCVLLNQNFKLLNYQLIDLPYQCWNSLL